MAGNQICTNSMLNMALVMCVVCSYASVPNSGSHFGPHGYYCICFERCVSDHSDSLYNWLRTLTHTYLNMYMLSFISVYQGRGIHFWQSWCPSAACTHRTNPQKVKCWAVCGQGTSQDGPIWYGGSGWFCICAYITIRMFACAHAWFSFLRDVHHFPTPLSPVTTNPNRESIHTAIGADYSCSVSSAVTLARLCICWWWCVSAHCVAGGACVCAERAREKERQREKERER